MCFYANLKSSKIVIHEIEKNLIYSKCVKSKTKVCAFYGWQEEEDNNVARESKIILQVMWKKQKMLSMKRGEINNCG